MSPVATQQPTADALRSVLVTLMRGVLDAEGDPTLWQSLLALQGRVRDYVRVLSLELMVDEGEGYAYLRQRPAEDGDAPAPRLISRRPLGYSVSLLLVLLRKKLQELDAGGGETRLILSRSEIGELVRLFHHEGTNEARAVDRVESDIGKAVELGFLRRLRGQEDRYEVRRLIKAFVDAQWLDSFEKKLAEYREHAGLGRNDAGPEERG